MLEKYNSDPKRCADLINGCAFQGSQLIDSAYLEYKPRKKTLIQTKIRQTYEGNKAVQEINQEENTLLKKENIDDYLEIVERERDVLRLHNHPDRRFYVACEAQAEADYSMPLREFTYDGVEYTDQYDSKIHRVTKDGKVKYMLPVIHIILYHGWDRWTSKHSLQEMMNIPEALDKYRYLIPDYHSFIIDIHEQNPDLFKTEWADVFRLMGKSRKKEELRKYMDEHIEEIRQLSKDTRMLLAVLLDQYEIMKDGRVEVKDMCEAWDGAMQMYADEAAERTRKELEKEYAEKIERVTESVTESVTKSVTQSVTESVTARISTQYKKLIAFLLDEKRYLDLERVSIDDRYCQELLSVLGI